jgi:hypothetical protein
MIVVDTMDQYLPTLQGMDKPSSEVVGQYVHLLPPILLVDA